MPEYQIIDIDTSGYGEEIVANIVSKCYEQFRNNKDLLSSVTYSRMAQNLRIKLYNKEREKIIAILEEVLE